MWPINSWLEDGCDRLRTTFTPFNAANTPARIQDRQYLLSTFGLVMAIL